MSATLGSVDFFADDLTERSGRETTRASSRRQRPVPLDFEYRTIDAAPQRRPSCSSPGKAPIYLVHFTQKEATEAAQNYLALDPLSKTEKAAGQGGARRVPVRLADRQGPAAVHHRRGRRPPRRAAAEVPAAGREARPGRPAQDHLRHRHARRRGERADPVGAVHAAVQVRRHAACGCCRIREFAQIAGRAGPQGVRRPRRRLGPGAASTWWRTSALAEKSREGGGKKKVVKKKQPERGYAHWTQDTFDKLVGGDPEPLRRTSGSTTRW